MPLDPPNRIRHAIPAVGIVLAVIGIVAPLMPLFGWVFGALELVALPVVFVLLRTTRKVEREIGVAVHQRQIALCLDLGAALPAIPPGEASDR